MADEHKAQIPDLNAKRDAFLDLGLHPLVYSSFAGGFAGLLFFRYHVVIKMKQIVKIMALLVALSACWISLLQTSVLPRSYTWLLPVYFIVSLGSYGLLMVGVGLMRFPTCPQESILLQEDIIEAKGFLKTKGVDVSSN